RDLLLFLPGVDGMSFEASRQFDSLSETFDAWCLTIPGSDRSSFADLSAAAIAFLEASGASAERPAIIAGTSFGGLLALRLAQERPALVKGLALVNPATAYPRSQWPLLGMLLTFAPSPSLFTLATVAALVALLPDTAKATHYIEDFLALPPTARPAAIATGATEWLSLLQGLFDEVSAESLRWRLTHWLQAGSDVVLPSLHTVMVPVVVVAGAEDRMLPSAEEAARLEAALPLCEAIVLPRLGHAVLLDAEALCLRDVLLASAVCDNAARAALAACRLARTAATSTAGNSQGGGSSSGPAAAGKGALPPAYDPVEDFVFDPMSAVVKRARERGALLERLTSPVFLSVTPSGRVVHGLGGIPDKVRGKGGRPLLFVGNHQLLGADLPLLIGRIHREKGILPRGLAHPI
ncbi:unnamed protein product, partial [Phaeothamnion confervicola]